MGSSQKLTREIADKIIETAIACADTDAHVIVSVDAFIAASTGIVQKAFPSGWKIIPIALPCSKNGTCFVIARNAKMGVQTFG